MQVIPSILTKPADDGILQIRRLLPYYQRFSIDIADGLYVPNTTATTSDYSKALKAMSAGEKKRLVVDFDLMVEDYEKNLEQLQILSKDITIGVVFVHYSSLKGRSFPVYKGLTIGVSVDARDQISDVDHHYSLKTIDNIQVMPIVAGSQGSPFMPEMLPKIEQAKSINYGLKIFIDGAVNLETLPALLALPYIPEYVCPGSYFSKSDNVEDQVNKMETLIHPR